MSLFSCWVYAYPFTSLQAVTIVALLLAALVIPACFTVSVLRVVAREVPRYSNYRGTPVMLGLGMVWLFFGLVLYAVAVCIPTLPAVFQHFITVLVFPLVTVMFGVGALDDWFGQYSSSRGFRAHFATLKQFTMSTGMLKLAVLAIVATVVSVHLFLLAQTYWNLPYSFVQVLGALLVIIFSTHLINLMDLRPLRASKIYLAFALVLLIVGLIVALAVRVELGGSLLVCLTCWFGLVLLSVLPPIITWRLDAGEQAMLGDAGANAMGAYLGALSCILLNPSWLFPLALILALLNIIFDRLSFSALVDRSALLTRIDMAGRCSADEHTVQDGNQNTRQADRVRRVRDDKNVESTAEVLVPDADGEMNEHVSTVDESWNISLVDVMRQHSSESSQSRRGDTTVRRKSARRVCKSNAAYAERVSPREAQDTQQR